jgi:hypothetical protein
VGEEGKGGDRGWESTMRSQKMEALIDKDDDMLMAMISQDTEEMKGLMGACGERDCQQAESEKEKKEVRKGMMFSNGSPTEESNGNNKVAHN